MRTDSRAQKIKLLYYAALIGLGFLWTGMSYIVQAYRLLQFLDGNTVNLLTCGLYYVCQAAGIGVVAYLFAKRPSVAGGRQLPLWSTIITFVCVAAAMFSSSVTFIIATGALMNVTIGVLSGCFLTRLATDVQQQRRGLLFGSAYALGSIGTWLVSLPMGGKFLWNETSILVVAALAVLSLFLVRSLPPLQQQKQSSKLLPSGINKKFLILAAVVLFLLSLENTLGFSFPLKSASGTVYIEFTRAFYAIGLVVAGFVSDKSRRWGAIGCIAALAFPFAATALGSSVAGETMMWVFAYLFLGFFSVYRILVFSDISEETGIPALAVLGLLAGRLGESVGTLGSGLSGLPLIVICGVIFAFIIIFFFPFFQKLYAPVINVEELEKRKFNEYINRYKLSLREQEIFSFIIRGMSNAEIADSLCITESTVKFHASNIFKKTGFANRSELIADFKLGSQI